MIPVRTLEQGAKDRLLFGLSSWMKPKRRLHRILARNQAEPRRPDANPGGVASPGVGVLLLVALITVPGNVRAGAGPLGIDSRPTYDNSGIWARSNQVALIDGMISVVVAGAVWEGGEDRLGKTFWQSVDAGAISGVAATALKYIFSRERPSQTSNPNEWFTGHGQSFPSGEVTTTSSLVTPFVLEYGKDHPAVYALEILPLYDAFARMKTWGHWQSDVIAGYALGTATGFFLHRSGSPLIWSISPHAIQIGLKMQF